MNISSDPNLWAICALVFLLGLLIGVFLTAGGRRKWKTRYNSELDRRREIEKAHEDRNRDFEAARERMAGTGFAARSSRPRPPTATTGRFRRHPSAKGNPHRRARVSCSDG